MDFSMTENLRDSLRFTLVIWLIICIWQGKTINLEGKSTCLYSHFHLPVQHDAPCIINYVRTHTRVEAWPKNDWWWDSWNCGKEK